MPIIEDIETQGERCQVIWIETRIKRLMNKTGLPCPRTRAFLMAHAGTLTINIYRTRQEGALYLLVN